MKKCILLLLACTMGIAGFAQSNDYFLRKVNRYLRTFDDGYYGPLEVRGQYLICNIKDGRHSKIRISDIGTIVRYEGQCGVQIKCQSGDCVTGVTGDMFPTMSFRTTDNCDETRFLSDMNNLWDELKGRGQMSSSSNDYYLNKVNRYLRTFDNGYYGPFEVQGGTLICHIKGGQKVKLPIAQIESVTRYEGQCGVQLNCRSGDCITGVSGSMYPNLTLRTTDDCDETGFLNDMKGLLNELQSGGSLSPSTGNGSYLAQINRYLRTFDNGYYGPLEVANGYLYCNIKDGRRSKIPLSEISEVIPYPGSDKHGVKILCRSGDCVTGVTGDMYPSMSLWTSDQADEQAFLRNMQRMVNEITRGSQQTTPSVNVPRRPQHTGPDEEKGDKG
ncbi:hypothetical protein [Pontibacter sp. G13]|uniref:hypothetical protein n=1 Tax=Pontibacter sp. G13 TaxID=3074898 RepID=UPI00288A8FB6|nr:hypothetical protein [Pontibacter sp. G13]WNJ18395.1 hypothetical protein RJD25_26370 [Pontibacter sp. G13]